MPLTAAERSELGKIGAASRLANEDPKDMTKAARERANWGRFYDQTDPSLPEPERKRRALALRDAHMAKMRLARSVTGRKAREAADAHEVAEAMASSAGAE